MISEVLQETKEQATSKLGLVEKAIIEIYDRRDKGVQLLAAQAVQSKAAAKTKAMMPDLMKQAENKLKDARAVYKETLQTVHETMADKKLTELSQPFKKTFVVPFNPSSLRIRARGRSIINVQSAGKSSNGAAQPDPKVTVTVSMRLIFDEVTVKGSFIEGRLNTAPSALVQNAAGAVKSAVEKGGVDPGVQKYVEGFVAAMSSKWTRVVGFRWGELYYFGRLNQVNTQYVMFNTMGQPVRAYVDLSLFDIDEKEDTEILGPRWQWAYNEAFGNEKLGLMRAGQKVGNLLNIG
ncbi:MAG: hypothetical protein IK016_03750 [Lachnospiraceae bacterium]|nr:hypothetical protein [Lachnospiraceae bacterium]